MFLKMISTFDSNFLLGRLLPTYKNHYKNKRENYLNLCKKYSLDPLNEETKKLDALFWVSNDFSSYIQHRKNEADGFRFFRSVFHILDSLSLIQLLSFEKFIDDSINLILGLPVVQKSLF